MIPELWRVPVQHKVGQQRLETRSVDSRHRLVAVDETEFTQQANVQNVYHAAPLTCIRPQSAKARMASKVE